MVGPDAGTDGLQMDPAVTNAAPSVVLQKALAKILQMVNIATKHIQGLKATTTLKNKMASHQTLAFHMPLGALTGETAMVDKDIAPFYDPETGLPFAHLNLHPIFHEKEEVRLTNLSGAVKKDGSDQFYIFCSPSDFGDVEEATPPTEHPPIMRALGRLLDFIRHDWMNRIRVPNFRLEQIMKNFAVTITLKYSHPELWHRFQTFFGLLRDLLMHPHLDLLIMAYEKLAYDLRWPDPYRLRGWCSIFSNRMVFQHSPPSSRAIPPDPYATMPEPELQFTPYTWVLAPYQTTLANPGAIDNGSLDLVCFREIDELRTLLDVGPVLELKVTNPDGSEYVRSLTNPKGWKVKVSNWYRRNASDFARMDMTLDELFPYPDDRFFDLADWESENLPPPGLEMESELNVQLYPAYQQFRARMMQHGRVDNLPLDMRTGRQLTA